MGAGVVGCDLPAVGVEEGEEEDPPQSDTLLLSRRNAACRGRRAAR